MICHHESFVWMLLDHISLYLNCGRLPVRAELAQYMSRYAVSVLNPASYPLIQAELMKTSYPLIKAELMMMVVMVMPFGIICRS